MPTLNIFRILEVLMLARARGTLAGMSMHPVKHLVAIAGLSLLLAMGGCGERPESNPSTRGQFLQFSVGAPENRRHALEWIDDHWQPGFESMAIEALSFAGSPDSRAGMVKLLERKTGQSLGADTDAWHRWLWREGPAPHPRYAQVKATYYATVDPRYREYFKNSPDSEIRLDEVQWVGLKRRDDLPPLNRPEMVAAKDSLLADAQLVYGIQLKDQARAYARALVSQHGVVRDTIEGQHFIVVDDGLTGSGAAYLLGDRQLAASGFLHRGDSLLYDQATHSLWSSLRGRPVVGPLVGKNIRLQPLPAVATHWSEWRHNHPHTRVTADDPRQQAYLMGQANYRKFVAKDRLIASAVAGDVAADTEVVGLVRHGQALAVPLASLHEQRVLTARLGDDRIAFITSTQDTTRAYLADDIELSDWVSANEIADSDNTHWQLTEDALINADGRRLPRLPLRQARWGVWAGAYSDTKVVR